MSYDENYLDESVDPMEEGMINTDEDITEENITDEDLEKDI